ncbi:hypothetical protein [Sphingobacterium multivorum]|uniref:hypothetical protein n=1 Tax=Sphingobacterium multivorum TaxID=28454 RepID=UPI0028A79F2E|nr:hypothetical protein [Sphingobacterium multivorum]
MKKLMMSAVALALMSSATFAKTGPKAADNSLVEKSTIYKSQTGKANLNIVSEAKEIKLGKSRTLCRLTMSIYNTSGQLIETQVLTYTSYGANDMYYSSCGAWFSATIQNYQNYYGNPNL